MLLIGSHALKFYSDIPNANKRFKDFDLICTYEEFERWAKNTNLKECYPIDSGKKMIAKTESNVYEFELAWPGSTAASLLESQTPRELRHIPDYWFGWALSFIGFDLAHPSLDILYTIKMSHRFLKNSPHFLKTMRDIQLMASLGAKIPETHKDWFKAREKATYTYAHPKLNQGKEGFFDKNQGVTYTYDHDSIHRAMAHLELPAYEYYKGDTAEVFCDKTKFDALPELTKLYGVIEEAYVLAIERSQVPFEGKPHVKYSFDKALEKVCTSITSGWFRRFSYDNYDKVQSLYDPNYMDKFRKGIEIGVVKKLC
jgi:hypothetical protein